MGDRMRENYQQLMRDPRFRARAEKSRTKKLEQRVASLTNHALMFGCLTTTSAVLLNSVEFFWLGVVAAAVALYCISAFVLDAPVLTMDLRTCEAATSPGEPAEPEQGSHEP